MCYSALTGAGHPCSCLTILLSDWRRVSVLTVLSQLPPSICLHTFLCASRTFCPTPQKWILLYLSHNFFIFHLARYPNLCLWMLFSLFTSSCLTCSLALIAHTFNLTVLPSCAFAVFLWNIHWCSLVTSKFPQLHSWISNCLSLFSTLSPNSPCFSAFNPTHLIFRYYPMLLLLRKSTSLGLWTAMTWYPSISL